MGEIKVGDRARIYHYFNERMADWISARVVHISKHFVRFMTEFGYPISLTYREIDKMIRAGELRWR